MRFFPRRWFWILLVAVAVGGAGVWYFHFRTAPAGAAHYKTPEEADPYVRFDMEAYDQIEAHYWNAGSGSDLAQLFQLSLQKAAGADETLATSTRAGVSAMLAAAFSTATSTDAKKNLAINTLVVALYNLAPAGRDQLLSQAQETALRNEVANVSTTTGQVQPTVFTRVLGKTLYVDITQIAPTSLGEFARAVDAASSTPLDSMIIDLRGNIGGALDFTQAFLGIFMGENQYAFDLYQKGQYEPQRTTEPVFPELARYKNIAILTDTMTQSTAELTTAAFKRYHVVTVVGTTTRGWGTVENTYPLTTQIDPSTSYALLLVNSITLGPDQQPIEGRGVVPDIDTSDANWKSELNQYFSSPSIIAALKQEATAPPLQ